jgi:RHS repeat-associated protein
MVSIDRVAVGEISMKSLESKKANPSKVLAARLAALALSVWIVSAAIPAQAAIAPLCGSDPTCTPDSGSGAYAGAVAARAKKLNARGFSSPTVAKAALGAAAASAAGVTVIGSQSYNYVIPILRLPGRAGMDLALNLFYNSRVWDVDTINSTITFNADRDFPSYGFRLDFGYLELSGGSWTLTEGDGTKELLPSTDGTNIAITPSLPSSATVTYPTGTKVQYQSFPSNANLWRPISIKDANGNFFTVTYVAGRDQAIAQISDSLGRVVTFNYDASNRLTSLTQPLHPSGTKTWATFTWGNPYPSGYSWFNFSGLTVNGAPAAVQVNVLTGCTYPNGTGYRFTYGDWGIVNKIERLSSTGLTRSYDSYDFPLASQGALTDAPSFAHQTISPDGGTANNSVWTYATTKNGTGVVTSLAVTDPNGTTSTTNLDPATGLTSSVQVKDSANNALRTVNYTWVTGPVTGAKLPGTITATNDAGQQASVQYTYDGNHFDQVTDLYEYDFGLQLKRHTVTTYLNGVNLNLHILNLPSQILAKDGAGNTVSRTDLAYDGTALTSVTGAANHDDANYPATFTNRGLITSVTRYANAAAGTGVLTRAFSYDSLGNLISAQLDCCNQEASSFSSATQYSFPDSITRGPASGPQFITRYTYDPDSSLILASTDENGQTTQMQYDSMSRPTLVTSPQGGTQVQVTTSYGDSALAPTVTRSSTANSLVSVTTLDGLGHVVRVDTRNGATLVSSVTSTYDKLFERTSVSNPFAPGDTVLTTSFSYDALGRVTRETPPSAGFTQFAYAGNAVTVTDPAGKQRKNITDALGRLIEVDEPGETFAGAPSGGTLTIGGTLLSQSGVGAAPGTGTIAIDGPGAQSTCCDGNGGLIWDSGQVSITVNGFTDLVPYSSGSPAYPFMLAQYLTATINGDNPYVTATTPNANFFPAIITLTARTVGASTNYPISASSTYDTADFSQPSFPATPSGATLTGGSNGSTIVDSGTVTVTIGSFTASAPYGQASNSTAAQVATALAGTGPTGLNRSGSPVTATVSGAAITLTYKTVGSAGNLTVTAVSTSNNANLFPSGSFSGSKTLTGGLDAYASGLAHPYATTYTYDVLDDLTAVSQAAGNVNGQPASGQARGYTYDSMGRQLTATTPESGLVTVFYTTASGGACAGDLSLPCRIQDARGVVKTLTYDGINRPAGVQYSDGTPAVTYTYDSGGAAAFALDRLTRIAEGPTNSQTFTYDNFGRVTSVSQVIDSTTYVTRYTYNLAGQLTAITYPSGRVVTQNVDAIGRLSSIASGTTTYLNGLSYNAAGETLGLTLGNGVQGAFTYNDRLQLASLRYSKSGVSPDVLNLGFDYGASNNGQIQAVHYNTSPGVEDATKSEVFTYDAWLRLSSAHTGVVNSTPGTWSLAWGYDRFGNRLNQILTGGNVTVTQPQLAVDPATNHVVGNAYDAAGNMTGDGVSTYSYDGANRLKQINAGSASYTYFGASRIKKVVGTSTTVYIYSGGRPIVEYVNGSLSKEYIYAGSRLLATLAGSSVTYHHPDQLSNRAETDSSGNVLRRFGHFPFGETWYETGTADKWKLTTFERDSGSGETGLDYARNRYYSSVQGRFLSADPVAGALGLPQSLNRYAYVMNDPINLLDPSGLAPDCILHVIGGDKLPQNAKDEINRILKDAGIEVSFGTGFGDDPSVTLNASNRQTTDKQKKVHDGYTPPGTNSSFINNGRLRGEFKPFKKDPLSGFDLGLGRVTAHEIVHGLLGPDDDDDADNLMGPHTDDATFGKQSGSMFSLNDGQKTALLLNCKALERKHRGGGGGGDRDFSFFPSRPDPGFLLLLLIATPAPDGLTPVVTHRFIY